MLRSKQPSAAILGTTVTIKNLIGNTTHLIAVVPRKFCTSTDVSLSKKSDPWKAKILRVDEDVLNEDIWLTAMLKI